MAMAMALASPASATWTIRASMALLACALTLFVEWQRPEFVVRLDEGLRDTFLRLMSDDFRE
jgi:hypothetical protein